MSIYIYSTSKTFLYRRKFFTTKVLNAGNQTKSNEAVFQISFLVQTIFFFNSFGWLLNSERKKLRLVRSISREKQCILQEVCENEERVQKGGGCCEKNKAFCVKTKKDKVVW